MDKGACVIVCAICGSVTRVRYEYDKPPEGEVGFPAMTGSAYERAYCECTVCGHFTAWMPVDPADFYSGEYVEHAYGGLEGIRSSFARITSLPPEQSDNVQRVAYIHNALRRHAGKMPDVECNPRLLDVGFGLGVFPAAMKARGWQCVGIDLDPRQIEHARKYIGISAHRADFNDISGIGPFDLITFNKVLEHLQDPSEFLTTAKRHLADGGSVYVELPDAEGAAGEGPDREEFFIDHLHVFSFASYALLARRSGWKVVDCIRVREPSGKYTLRGLLRPDD